MIERTEPFLTYNFLVAIEGLAVAGFMEVSAIAAETTVEKIKVGGLNQSEISLIGPTKYSDVTLKQGLAWSRELLAWHEAVVRGYGLRSNIHITALDARNSVKATWSLLEAVPIKWDAPILKATASEMAIASITFTHNGILRLM
ncbi:MAG: phage tail protein [Bdellovibrionales bacterium]